MTIKRELWKKGRKIAAFIEQREENGEIFYYVMFGKPSDSCFISWRCKTYAKAKERAMTAFPNVEPNIVVG